MCVGNYALAIALIATKVLSGAEFDKQSPSHSTAGTETDL